MKKHILYTLLLLGVMIFEGKAQDRKFGIETDAITIYPNPTTNQKITIQTDSNQLKEVEIFDMLGKKVFSTSFFSREKELFLQSFQAGIYIVKIREEQGSTTRKLIVK